VVGVKGHAPKDKPSEAEVSTKEPSKGEPFNEKTSTAKKCSDDLSKTASGELQRIRFRETHFDESGMIKTTDADAKPNMQVEKSEGKVTYAFIWERIFDRYNKYFESNVDIVSGTLHDLLVENLHHYPGFALHGKPINFCPFLSRSFIIGQGSWKLQRTKVMTTVLRESKREKI